MRNCRGCQSYDYVEDRSEGEPNYNTLDKKLVPKHYCNEYDYFIDQIVVDKFNSGLFSQSYLRESFKFYPKKVYDENGDEIEGESWLSNAVWYEFRNSRYMIEQELSSTAQACDLFAKKGEKKYEVITKEEFKRRLLSKK